jgi:hypothetical protein
LRALRWRRNCRPRKGELRVDAATFLAQYDRDNVARRTQAVYAEALSEA